MLTLPRKSQSRGKPDLAPAIVLGNRDFRLDPYLCLACFVMHVYVRSWLFPGEEVEPEPTSTEDRGTHRVILPRPLKGRTAVVESA